MSDCIFCKLANKEIPTEFLYEDENVVAFNDLNPLTPVHVLVVPKNHYDNIIDGISAMMTSRYSCGLKSFKPTLPWSEIHFLKDASCSGAIWISE